MIDLGSRRWKKAFGSLNGTPGSDWRSRLVHHGARGLLVLAAAAVILLLFPRTPLPQFAHLEEGVVAEEDVIAEIAFPVRKSEDRLEEERQEAARSVPPVFTLEPTAVDSSIRRTERFFAAVDSAVAAGGDAREAVGAVLDRYGIAAAPEQVAALADAGTRGRLREALAEAMREFLPGGVAPASHLDEVASGQVVVRGSDRDRRTSTDSIPSLGSFYQRAVEGTPDSFGAPALQLFQTLAVRFAEPTLRLDRAATAAARRQARQAVEPNAGHVLQGERIVAAHERVGAAEMEELRSYRESLRERGMVSGEGRWLRAGGAGLHALALLVLLGGVLLLFRESIYRDMRDFSVVFGLSLSVLFVASLISELSMSSALVPVALAALLIGGLYDGLLSLVTVGILAALLAGQPAYGGAVPPFLTLAGGAAAALGVRSVHRRADSWILIAIIGGAYAVAGAVLVLMRSLPAGELLTIVGYGSANAATCTLFAMGAILPALERFTGITTDQTLLELCDLNRPLLRELSREAPGTYAHSINVANLAEAASEAIGANCILTRAGVYYHDIGKMARPQFFIENQPKGRNPHDRIPPELSAEVIKGHVSEGVRKARDARLPEAVVAFIREHHGTMKISYFLEKAREAGEDPDPEDFRYDGPRPQSRETAVVMLADGVESASRTLADPTPERIRELVDGIFRTRVEGGQLDECPLTLRDLERTKEEFVRVLAHMYHRRVEYPDAAAVEPRRPEFDPADLEPAGQGAGAVGGEPVPERRDRAAREGG